MCRGANQLARDLSAAGSGLGLAISQLLARQIGAEIALLSTGPGGTTFGVTLPVPAASDEKLRRAV